MNDGTTRPTRGRVTAHLASPTGWIYLGGELLLVAAVLLLVAPMVRDRSAS